MAGDYFTAGDRIPYDSCPDPFYTPSPYTELSPLQERMMELSKDINDRLEKLDVPRGLWIKVVLLVCDAHDDGVKDGIQMVKDNPESYFRSAWE